MILKKKKKFNSNFIIIFFISLFSFVVGIFFHDAKLAYHLKQYILNKKLVIKNFSNNFFFYEIDEIKIDIPFKTQKHLENN
uniref:hypothetical protein n=1 Tax=Candidatus Pelagibacter sp. TaxID=2024849 RepID=UPI003F856E73